MGRAENKNIAISFENVSKMYRLGLVGTGTLGQDLNRWWRMSVLHQEDPYLKVGQTNDRSTKGESDFVYALRDINFQVEKGDVLGIIGKNGAGKSTLLKLLSRITAPSTGSIKTRGRLASLLEVGTGFHPELTGRENIYMNGSIMGMTKAEITRKLDEIIDFAGVERYIDTPCKRYSSGMQVRLGFAVAAFLEPEILVVDEVLAVGDAEFQKKAIGKMQSVVYGDGRTVLFVSHNMASVRKLCRSGIVLKNGMIEYAGTAEDCVNYYQQNIISELVGYAEIGTQHRLGDLSQELEYVDIRMLNDVKNMSNEEPLEFEMTMRRNNPSIKECQFGVIIRDSADIPVGGCYSPMTKLPDSGTNFKIRLTFPDHQLAKGKYSLNFNISKFDYTAIVRDYDVAFGAIKFEVKFVDAKHTKPFLVWPKLGGCAFNKSIVQIK